MERANWSTVYIIKKGLARSRELLGWSGDDLEAVIDLGKDDTISSAVIHSLVSGGSWVYPPQYAELFMSQDGKNFTTAGRSKDLKQQLVPTELLKFLLPLLHAATKKQL